ncbi:BamA/TamA family outer membrane protein [Porifericola rhodea]|uniref:POTRA domain-containing protein n=1 Tax=Porifericola rhodea TaxID=930972 RepID=UPI0026651D47|nr:POTRA domain-containing protein [Porifericola rhodea]WKN33641.1 BamA/TamA family outer membrane protein [Porifericola rhodea]
MFTLLCKAGQLQAQLILETSAEDQKVIRRNYSPKDKPLDSLAAIQEATQVVSMLQKQGYLTAHFSQLQKLDSTLWKLQFNVGPRFQWALLQVGNLDQAMQEQSGFRERLFLNEPFSYQEIAQMFEEILEAAENKGFPFASIRLNEIRIVEEEVTASLLYQPGPFITFGELHVEGTHKIDPAFLATFLKVEPSGVYSEKKVKQIEAAMASLSYVELVSPPEVRFQNDEAEIYLNLKERKVNQVDGLINFLPNENEGGKVLLTGSVEILLNNLMRKGRRLHFKWQRLQLESQQLNIAYEHTYLFRSPLQAAISFSLLKEDTLYINRNLQFALSYPLPKGSMINLRSELRNSNILSELQPGVKSSFAEIRDFSLLNFSIGLHFNRLNNVVFPTNGWQLITNTGLGRKNSLTEKGGALISWQPFSELSLSQYHKLGGLALIYHRLSGVFVHGEHLYLNDLYRLGGIRTLRGFTDNFYFSAFYGLSNLEFRLLLEEETNTQSYVYAFYDQAYLGHSLSGDYNLSPLGFGLGLSLSTDLGIFNIAYAIGKSDYESIDFSTSKIHFGYISRF